MSSKFMIQERTLGLAERLLANIRAKGLRKGDGFMTTLEVAEYLGVSCSSAGRALRLLESGNVISRGQKIGAIIKDDSFTLPKLRRVHLLTNGRLPKQDAFVERVQAGVREELPWSHVDVTRLHSKTEQATLEKILACAKASGETHGFIMQSVSPWVQNVIGRSGFPCVSHGSRIPGTREFSSLDIDHVAVLRLLHSYLRRRGRSRITLVFRRVLFPGDTNVLNAALRMGIPNSFFLQHREDDPCLVDELVELIDKKYSPDGFICLNSEYASAVSEALARLGMPPETAEVTVMYNLTPENNPSITYTAPLVTAELAGRQLASMLVDSVLGVRPHCDSIPMVLVERTAGRTKNGKGNEKQPVPPDPLVSSLVYGEQQAAIAESFLPRK